MATGHGRHGRHGRHGHVLVVLSCYVVCAFFICLRFQIFPLHGLGRLGPLGAEARLQQLLVIQPHAESVLA